MKLNKKLTLMLAFAIALAGIPLATADEECNTQPAWPQCGAPAPPGPDLGCIGIGAPPDEPTIAELTGMEPYVRQLGGHLFAGYIIADGGRVGKFDVPHHTSFVLAAWTDDGDWCREGEGAGNVSSYWFTVLNRPVCPPLCPF